MREDLDQRTWGEDPDSSGADTVKFRALRQHLYLGLTMIVAKF